MKAPDKAATGKIDPVSHTLGSLETSMKVVSDNQEQMRVSVKSLEDDMAEVKTSLANVSTVVNEIRPAAKKINNWEQRVLGVALAGSMFGGLMMAKLKEMIWG